MVLNFSGPIGPEQSLWITLKSHINQWRPVRDSNPCCRRERADYVLGLLRGYHVNRWLSADILHLTSLNFTRVHPPAWLKFGSYCFCRQEATVGLAMSRLRTAYQRRYSRL